MISIRKTGLFFGTACSVGFVAWSLVLSPRSIDRWDALGALLFGAIIAVGLPIWYRLGTRLRAYVPRRFVRWLVLGIASGLVFVTAMPLPSLTASRWQVAADLADVAAQGLWIAMLLALGLAETATPHRRFASGAEQ